MTGRKESHMKAGKRIQYEDEFVVVTKNDKIVYSGLEDYEPMKREMWIFVMTTKDGKGHYEFNGYKKYRVR